MKRENTAWFTDVRGECVGVDSDVRGSCEVTTCNWLSIGLHAVYLVSCGREVADKQKLHNHVPPQHDTESKHQVKSTQGLTHKGKKSNRKLANMQVTLLSQTHADLSGSVGSPDAVRMKR